MRGSGSLYLRRGIWQHKAVEADGVRRPVSLGTRNKTEAQQLARFRMERIRQERAGLISPRDAKLEKAARVPLAQHAKDWARTLGGKPGHARKQLTRVNRILAAGNLMFPAELTHENALGALRLCGETEHKSNCWRTGRRLGGKTRSYYFATFKAFCRWMVQGDRLRDDPRLGKGGRLRSDVSRRALTRDEFAALAAVAQSAASGRLVGLDRRMFYEIPVQTGFRLSEVASLTPASFHLRGERPYVVLSAGATKNAKPAEQPVMEEFAGRLDDWLSPMDRGKPVFRVPANYNRMLRADCRKAGIARPAEIGYHCLRHTFIYWCKLAGLTLYEAKELARHSDVSLTVNVYGRLSSTDLSSAVEKLGRKGQQQRRLA